MPILVMLLPDFVLVTVLVGLRFIEISNHISHFAIAVTSGALAGCIWSNIRLFLFERPDERKFRAILIGASGAALFSFLYLAFGNWLVEFHELFFIRRRGGVGPPFTDPALAFMYVGMFGAAVSLLVDHGLNNWR